MARGYQRYDRDGKGRIYPHAEVRNSIPEFGLNAPVLKSQTFNLAVAANDREVEVGGSVLWCMDCSSRTAYVQAKLNDQMRDPIILREGLFIKGLAFSRLYLTWPAQAGETLTIYYAVDEEGRFDVKNPAYQFTQVDLTKSTVLETATDVTLVGAATTQILAANANRRSAIIGNLGANASIMRIGDANAGAARGAELAPGESITIESTEAIYGYNPGANQDVTVVWTED